MEEYKKQINKIAKTINEIPYEKVYLEIATANDRFILEKNKKSNPIGFKAGDKP